MKHFFSFLTFGCIVLLTLFAGTCKDEPPVKPPPPPAPPDTTSHDYQFTLYEVGGMNSVFYDVAALSPDFVIATGKIERESSDLFINAYQWNGIDLKPIHLPVNPYDSNTINPTPIPTMPINSIWAFRRDNIWYTCEVGAAVHMTITKGDTNIKNYGYGYRSDIAPSFGGRIWAKDTSEIYFGNRQGIMYKYKSGFWTSMTPATHGGDIFDMWGYDSKNIWITSKNKNNEETMYRWDGNNWKLLWLFSDPSLSDSIYFGAPRALWGMQDEDSLWISGFWIGKMKKDGTGKITPIYDVHIGGAYRIKGSSKNNVFFISYDGFIGHFNGGTMRVYDIFNNQNINFFSLSVLNDDVYIVGYKYFGGAVFVHGKKIK